MRAPPPSFPKTLVIQATETWIAADKPAGALVHNSEFAGPRERSLREELRARLKRPVVPVHRLDRGTSGIILFATAPAHVAALQASLAAASARKHYLGLVRGRVEEDCAIDHPVKTKRGELLEARSVVRPVLVSEVARCSVVEVELLTGRMHQARLHMRHLHCPILGDSNYGDTRVNRVFRERFGLNRLGLHAHRLKLTLPSGQNLALSAPISDDLLQVFARLFAPEELARLVGQNVGEARLDGELLLGGIEASS